MNRFSIVSSSHTRLLQYLSDLQITEQNCLIMFNNENDYEIFRRGYSTRDVRWWKIRTNSNNYSWLSTGKITRVWKITGRRSLFRYSFWLHGPRSQFTLRTEKSIRKYFWHLFWFRVSSPIVIWGVWRIYCLESFEQ